MFVLVSQSNSWAQAKNFFATTFNGPNLASIVTLLWQSPPKIENQALLTLPGKNYKNIYYATKIEYKIAILLSLWLHDLFPSIASFFFWQIVQRNRPSRGLDTGVIKWSVFIDKPLLEGWSARQTAQRYIPEFVLEETSFPSLHFKESKNP